MAIVYERKIPVADFTAYDEIRKGLIKKFKSLDIYIDKYAKSGFLQVADRRLVTSYDEFGKKMSIHVLSTTPMPPAKLKRLESIVEEVKAKPINYIPPKADKKLYITKPASAY
jgi:hypothetical protein